MTKWLLKFSIFLFVFHTNIKPAETFYQFKSYEHKKIEPHDIGEKWRMYSLITCLHYCCWICETYLPSNTFVLLRERKREFLQERISKTCPKRFQIIAHHVSKSFWNACFFWKYTTMLTHCKKTHARTFISFTATEKYFPFNERIQTHTPFEKLLSAPTSNISWLLK